MSRLPEIVTESQINYANSRKAIHDVVQALCGITRFSRNKIKKRLWLLGVTRGKSPDEVSLLLRQYPLDRLIQSSKK